MGFWGHVMSELLSLDYDILKEQDPNHHGDCAASIAFHELPGIFYHVTIWSGVLRDVPNKGWPGKSYIQGPTACKQLETV